MELTINRDYVDGEDSFIFVVSVSLVEGPNKLDLHAENVVPVSRFLGEKLLSLTSVEVSSVLFGKLVLTLRREITESLRQTIYEQIGAMVRPVAGGGAGDGSAGVPATTPPGA